MTIVSEKEQLTQIISQVVEELFSRELPDLLRKAKRKEYINTDELMDLTGWDRRRIQYLRDQRRIPFSQEGRIITYRTSDIEAYLEETRISPIEKD